MHPTFKNVGKATGLEIWRIENLAPVVVPPSTHGKFFTGDSYIVLSTKGDAKSRLSWDIHFWLGLDTTQDEAGAAAILSVQLDDALGGAPVQYREVQGHESTMFLSYFKNGVRYVSGGIASGFKMVSINDDGPKRLFHVKGKRTVRVNEIEPLVSKMNTGDCFILDNGRDIYVYVGPKSNGVEKMKAVTAANDIRDQDHNGRSAVHICDDEEKKDFFTALGSGSAGDVPSASKCDEEFEKETADKITLYKVSDASGQLKVEEIASGSIQKEMLDSDDCFILDSGTALYAWIGQYSSKKEKQYAYIRAQDFIKSKNYPPSTVVHRVNENTEQAAFKQLFEN